MSKGKGKKIQVPEALYNRLEETARKTNRSVSDVFVECMLGKNKA